MRRAFVSGAVAVTMVVVATVAGRGRIRRSRPAQFKGSLGPHLDRRSRGLMTFLGTIRISARRR